MRVCPGADNRFPCPLKLTVNEFKGSHECERLAEELLILFDQTLEKVRLDFELFTHADFVLRDVAAL